MRPVGFTLLLLTGLSASAFADLLLSASGIAPLPAARSSEVARAESETLAPVAFSEPQESAVPSDDAGVAHAPVAVAARHSGFAFQASEPALAGPAASGEPASLGASKRPHFGRFSARLE